MLDNDLLARIAHNIDNQDVCICHNCGTCHLWLYAQTAAFSGKWIRVVEVA